MRSSKPNVAIHLVAVWTLIGVASPAAAVPVPGNANIFGAGHAVPPAPAGGGGGTLPTQAPLVIVGGAEIRFPSVTGLVNEGSGPVYENSWNGPDGTVGASDYNSVGGIAGLEMPVRMPLVGVFLDDSEPTDPAPPQLNFLGAGGTDFATLSPGLRQVFFIGNGRTGQDSLQTFIAPPSATRLFLGIADADSHHGDPGFYGDNQGAFEVTVVPEPVGAVWLVAAGAALICRRSARRA